MKKFLLAVVLAIPLLGHPYAYAEEAATQDVQVKDSWCTRVRVEQDETAPLQKVVVENSKFIWITVTTKPLEIETPAEE